MEFAAWQARDIDAVMPNGVHAAESFRQFYRRCIATISELAHTHAGKSVALVAHGGVLECAYRCATSLALSAPRNFSVANASINRFIYLDGKLQLSSWGEVAHLQPGALDELA